MPTRDYKIRFRQEGAEKVTAATGRIERSFNRLGGVIASAFAVEQLGQFAFESVQLAGKVESLQRAFDRLSRSEGLDPAKLFGDLQKATDNTVSSVKLLQATTQGKFLGVDIQNMPVLFEFAAKRARETGQSVDFLVESIVTGIGRKSALILDNLGITMPQLRAEMERLAKETGIWTGKLDEATQNVVLQQAAVNIAKEAIKESGDEALTAADKIAQYTAAWENFKVSVGEGLITLFGRTVEFFRAVGGVIDSLQTVFAKFSTDAAIQASENLTKKLKAMETGAQGAKKAVEDMANMRGTLPVDKFKIDVLIEKQRRAREEAKRLAAGLAELRRELSNPVSASFVSTTEQATTALKNAEKEVRRLKISGEKVFAGFEKIFLIEQAKVALDQMANSFDMLEEKSIDFTVQTSADMDYARQKFLEFGQTMSNVFAENLKEGENMFDGLLNAFTDMLTQMVSELLAKSAIFGLLNLFGIPTGGTFSEFLFGGASFGGGGTAFSVATGGGGGGAVQGTTREQLFTPSNFRTNETGQKIVNEYTIHAIDAQSFENFLRYRDGAKAISKTLPEVIA